MPSTEPKDHLLLRAARGETIDRVPVWAMRQAGRWDDEFRKIRAGTPFFEFSEDVDRAVAGTLAPRRFGVDGIILFYDITTLPIAMGLPFELVKDTGPVPLPPIRTMADVEKLNAEPSPDSYSHIRQLAQRVKAELCGELPMIVFAGAPFTVATYCIGTGKDMAATARFVAEQPAVWQELLNRISHATSLFLNQLIDDGAEIYQLFDSWAGMLNVEDYQRWANPYHARVFREVTRVPGILFVKECPHVELMSATGCQVLSLGTSHNLAEVQAAYPHLSVQGNVDESILRSGTPTEVEAAVVQCLQQGGGRRHILNLNHGVGKETPMANFEAYIHAAKAFRV